MNTKKLLPLLILQIVPLLIFPPALLAKGFLVIIVLILMYVGLGYGLLRGRMWALTLSILLQGLNIVIRLMMLFPNSFRAEGANSGWDVPYAITSILAIALSAWFLARLDRGDIRAMIMA